MTVARTANFLGGKVIALDSASDVLALAVADARFERSEAGERVLRFDILASADADARRCANEQLFARIDAMLAEIGLVPSDIDAVVCGRGPGSFTGVRIGVASAKGMASGLRVPLYGASTLDSVAWGVWKAGYRGALGVLADAMRGEVYPVRYDLRDEGPHRLDSDTVNKPAAALDDWFAALDGAFFVTGDGLKKYRRVLDDKIAEYGLESVVEVLPAHLWAPFGEGLICAWAAGMNAAAARGSVLDGDPGTLLPVYTRLSDAEENERIRLSETGETHFGALVDASLLDAGDFSRGDAAAAATPEGGVGRTFSKDGVVYRPLSVHDIPAVQTLQTDAFPEETFGEAFLQSELRSPQHTWWVATVHEKPIAYAAAWLVADELQIFDIVVADEWRRHGIAKMLLYRVIHDGADLGAIDVTLEVRESNAPARTLYEALGFAVEGRRPDYYVNSRGVEPAREAAILMRASIRTVFDVLDADRSFATLAGMELVGTALEARDEDAAPRPLILAIESSCDETAAAIVDGTGKMLSDCVASQIDFHARFGGVVPEIASRKHTEAIVGVVEETLERAGANLGRDKLEWSELDGIAVTQGPGLVGALVVGLAFAKGVSWATGLPLMGVNHLEGHLYANKLVTPDIEPPLVASIVSGGHTMLIYVREWGSYEILGSTVDDAVGEAFDKVAKALGLGYPGGPVISRQAAMGDPKAIRFPRPMINSGDYAFSLSGLKTAVVTYIAHELEEGRELNIPDIAASFQAAVVDVQIAKAEAAIEATGAKEFCLGGGVAANGVLRQAYLDAFAKTDVRVTLPPLAACTDNASMIAMVALDLYARGEHIDLGADVQAHMPL